MFGDRVPEIQARFSSGAAKSRHQARLADTAPHAFSALVLGMGMTPTPFLGTTLLPDLGVVLAGFMTDADGRAMPHAPWPAGIAAGSHFYAQWFVVETGTPFGFASSNAVQGTTP